MTNLSATRDSGNNFNTQVDANYSHGTIPNNYANNICYNNTTGTSEDSQLADGMPRTSQNEFNFEWNNNGHHVSKKISLYKTELCRTYEETGYCRYGLKCQFAHDLSELRTVTRHPRYKTEICKTFWDLGNCPYGKRCCFIHTEKPVSQKEKPTSPEATTTETVSLEAYSTVVKPARRQSFAAVSKATPSETELVSNENVNNSNTTVKPVSPVQLVPQTSPPCEPLTRISPLITPIEYVRKRRLPSFQAIQEKPKIVEKQEQTAPEPAVAAPRRKSFIWPITAEENDVGSYQFIPEKTVNSNIQEEPEDTKHSESLGISIEYSSVMSSYAFPTSSIENKMQNININEDKAAPVANGSGFLSKRSSFCFGSQISQPYNGEFSNHLTQLNIDPNGSPKFNVSGECEITNILSNKGHKKNEYNSEHVQQPVGGHLLNVEIGKEQFWKSNEGASTALEQPKDSKENSVNGISSANITIPISLLELSQKRTRRASVVIQTIKDSTSIDGIEIATEDIQNNLPSDMLHFIENP